MVAIIGAVGAWKKAKDELQAAIDAASGDQTGANLELAVTKACEAIKLAAQGTANLAANWDD